MKILDRIITLLLLVILAPIAIVIVATLIVNWDQLPAVGVVIAGYGVQAVELAFLCMRLALAIGVAAAVALGIRYGMRWWHNYNQPRDGSHHLRTYKVRDPVTGQKVSILVNPDLMITPALAVGGHGVRELGTLPAELYAGHAQQRATVAAWQARTPGDEAIMTSNGSMYRMGSLGGSAKPMAEQPALPAPRIVGDEDAPLAPTAEPMQLGDALRSSNPDQFVLGHNPAGTTAIWQPREHLNLGVFGVSGTGKTKSTGFQTMLLAARHGYHVVCLDPKGGADFGAFAKYVEWQPTDSYTFADQVAALYQVHAERHAIMRDHQVGEWRALGQYAGPEIVVVLEEFGTIREEIAVTKGGGRRLEAVDHTVEMMFRWARMTGFHFVVIDQAPEKLHPVVRGGCKLRLAYHLDISSASVLKEYEATALPPVGEFMISRRQYQAWNCDAHLPQLLQRLQPFAHQRLLPPPAEDGREGSSQSSSQPVHGAVHGQFMGSSPEVAPPPPSPVNTTVNTPPETVEGWYEWTLDNYLGAHPELLQLDARGRGMGVTALAAAMAAENGKDLDAMKGTASEVAKRLRGDIGFMDGGGVAYGVNETGGKKEKA